MEIKQRSLQARFLTPRWILLSLLVIAVVGLFTRLGFWQLDRLAQRRASNARVKANLAAPVLNLNDGFPSDRLPAMEYRAAQVTGEFDYSQQVAQRNQMWQGQVGVHLLTPLKITGTSQWILVDRGWIPYTDDSPAKWAKYDPPGAVTVYGRLRLEQSESGFLVAADPFPTPGHERILLWNRINIERIGVQTTGQLLPVYFEAAPGTGTPTLPYRAFSAVDLSEGPHLSYAVQWFIFAAALALGFPVFVWYQLMKRSGAPTVKSGEFERKGMNHPG